MNLDTTLFNLTLISNNMEQCKNCHIRVSDLSEEMARISLIHMWAGIGHGNPAVRMDVRRPDNFIESEYSAVQVIDAVIVPVQLIIDAVQSEPTGGNSVCNASDHGSEIRIILA